MVKKTTYGKYFPWIAMLFMTIAISDVLLVYRLVNFMGLIITAGVFVMPIYYMMQDVVTEIYGFYTSRLMVIVMIICQYIFSFIITGLIHLPFPNNWQHHHLQYQFVLGHLFRTNILGLLSVLIGAYVNIFLISKWRKLTQGRYFWMRSLGSSSIGEMLATIIGSFVLYYGVYPLTQIIQLIWPVCLLLVIQNVIYSFIGTIVVYILKQKEGDLLPTPDFNPFTT